MDIYRNSLTIKFCADLFPAHRCPSVINFQIPYYRKLTFHEIKVLEINANLMENDFRIKKINAREEVEFHKREINASNYAKSKEKILKSLLKAATMKMNSKYCKPLP